jgi:PIN domain nuclease of toxin-antitoxin system
LLHDNKSWFIAADFDEADWIIECPAFIKICEEYDIPAYLERSRSGKGGHVGIFFEEPYEAFRSRKIMTALLQLEDAKNEAFVSAVTFWEISLKFGLGKLELSGATPNDLPGLALKAGFSLLPLLPEEAAMYHSLEASWHKDPFGRMLMKQAIHNKLTLLSKDSIYSPLSVRGLKDNMVGTKKAINKCH